MVPGQLVLPFEQRTLDEPHDPTRNDGWDPMADAHDITPIETRFEEARAMLVIVAGRVVTLTADAIVLTLAAPFFAVWWIAKTVRRMMPKG